MSDTFAEPTVTGLFFENSEAIDLFAKAFPKAQGAMGDVLKKATNPAFKSKYADLSAVVEAVIPPLNENGFSVLQPSGFDEGRVKVMTLILHESGQWMRCTLSLNPTKLDPQGIGSAITYGRRYGLQAMSGVAPEDDDGNAASFRGKTQEREPDRPSNAAMVGVMKAAIAVCDDLPALKAWKDDNAKFIADFEANDLDAYNDVVRAWKNRGDAIRRMASAADTFDIAADEAGQALEAA